MRCPNCGEPVETRHSFCVVCGADLEPLKSQSVKQREADAGQKLRTVLNQPVRLRRPETKSDTPEQKSGPPADTELFGGAAEHPV